MAMATLAVLEGAGMSTPPTLASRTSSAKASVGQGLTLVHYSAHRKHILWDTLVA